MSTPINWQTLTPEQRDRIVAEKIFHWQPVPCDEELTIYDDGMAFCYGCKQRDHISAFEHGVIAHPAYTQSMDSAWLVVKMMNDPQSPAYPDYQNYANFIDHLQAIIGSDLFFDLFYCDKDGDHLTPERICIAALRAVGCEVEL